MPNLYRGVIFPVISTQGMQTIAAIGNAIAQKPSMITVRIIEEEYPLLQKARPCVQPVAPVQSKAGLRGDKSSSSAPRASTADRTALRRGECATEGRHRVRGFQSAVRSCGRWLCR